MSQLHNAQRLRGVFSTRDKDVLLHKWSRGVNYESCKLRESRIHRTRIGFRGHEEQTRKQRDAESQPFIRARESSRAGATLLEKAAFGRRHGVISGLLQCARQVDELKVTS